MKIVIQKRSYVKWSHFIWYLILILSCGVNDADEKINDGHDTKKSIVNGEDFRLAQQYCGICHQFVLPDKLPKEYWKIVLTKMSRYMGFNKDGDPYYGHTKIALDRLDSAKVFPTEQIISVEDWQKIVLFYLNNAPDTLDHGFRPHIDFNMKQFEVKTIPWKTPLQGPTFVRILKNNQIAVGFSKLPDQNELFVIDVLGNEISKRNIPSALTSIAQHGREIFFSFMGSFQADDTPAGTIGKMTVNNQLTFSDSIEYILTQRERPIEVNTLDANGDQRIDILSSEFGKFLGGLYLYLQNESGAYQRKTIYKGPGAITTIIRDVNRDGLPDIYALISQGNEGIYLFTNVGGGEFEGKKLIQFPPYYGSVHMSMLDFDQDSIEDIIYTNGDNGDFGNIIKPFHGIRLFKGKGPEVFEESWFYPQQGAYQTRVIDYDQDGDLDIAAIGFFAYGTSLQKEGFLFLENLGSPNGRISFKTYSFKAAQASSFMVMDAGDVDEDGDIDLILGASTSLMSVNEMVEQLVNWESKGGAVVLLENTLK